jgi:aryl-alcohol dehydrogenase-like predicted oxidoreductase
MRLLRNAESSVTDFIPLPGTTHMKYLEDNAGAVAVDFTAEDEARFRKALDSIGGAKGPRWAGIVAEMCFADTPELDGV